MDEKLFLQLAAISEEERRLMAGEAIDEVSYFASGRVADADKLLADREVRVRTHTRFADFPAHSHNYIEMVYMASGSTTHIVGEERLVIGEGDLLLLNRRATHRVLRADEGDVAVNILVRPSFFDSMLSVIGRDEPLADFLLGSLSRPGDAAFLLAHTAERPPLRQTVESLLWLAVIDNAEPRLLRAAMQLLMLQLLERADALALPRTGGRALIAEALHEIEGNFRTASLNALAQRHGVSAAYLSRIVKAATGETFVTLLQRRRMETAADWLAHTDLAVFDICEGVGYDNTSHFHRLFKAHFGMTPHGYRRLKKNGFR